MTVSAELRCEHCERRVESSELLVAPGDRVPDPPAENEPGHLSGWRLYTTPEPPGVRWASQAQRGEEVESESHMRNVAITETNPAGCTPGHDCAEHEAEHQHGPGCGHEAVQHGDHVDYAVAGHLHHPHDDHCDDHGPFDS